MQDYRIVGGPSGVEAIILAQVTGARAEPRADHTLAVSFFNRKVAERAEMLLKRSVSRIKTKKTGNIISLK